MIQTFDPFDPQQWTESTGCEAFEIALAMRAKSALAAQAIPVLEAHLEACVTCREYAASMDRFDAALATRLDGEPADAVLERIRNKLHARVRRYQQRTPWVIALAGGGTVAVTILLRALLDPGSVRIGATLSGPALYLAVMAFAYWRASRGWQRLLEQDDVVAAYRSELEQRVRTLRTARWLWPLALACAMPGAYGALLHVLDGNVHARARLAMTCLFAICAIGAFVGTLVRLRAARHELEGLR